MPFSNFAFFYIYLDLSTMSRIARGARRATVVATATVVAGINHEVAGSMLRNDFSPDLSPDGSLLSTGKPESYAPPYHSHTSSIEKPGNGHPCKSPCKFFCVFKSLLA